MPQKSVPFFTRPTLLALAAAACASASAQDNTQTLSEVVVSASGFEQQIKDAPASISVVTRQDLETKNFRDLADALQGVEGIDVRGGTGKTGGFDISIRGMPSDYTLILVDGRRVSAAGDTTPNGFGASQTSLIPPLSAIERIEVVRGPMSTLYGSDAMGGVINIITRKIAKEWGGSVQIEGSLPEHSNQGAAQKTSFYLNGPIQQDKLGIAIRGNYYNRDKSEMAAQEGVNPSSYKGIAPPKSDQYTLGAKFTFAPAAGHELWLDVETARTKYDNRECELGNLDLVCGQTPDKNTKYVTTHPGYSDSLRFNRDQYALGYKGNLDIGVFETSLSYTSNETKGRTLPNDIFDHDDPISPSKTPVMNDPLSYLLGSPRKLESTSTIWDTKLVTPLGERNLLSVGTQYVHSTAKDGIPMLRNGSTFKQNTWAIFAENEWSVTDTLIATGGLRYDHHDKFGGHWTPRAYLVWNATDMFTFKGGVSQGFRAPKVNQLVDGIAGVGGQGTTTTFGNPDLKPEESTSSELGMLFNNQKGWTGNFTVFHNKLKNKIQSQDCGDGQDIAACATLGASDEGSFYINRDRAKTWGFEVGTKYVFSPQWDIAANYTWTDSELLENGKVVGKLSDTAKHIANVTLNWKPDQQWSVWSRVEYRGKSRRFDTPPTSGDNKLAYEALGADLKAYTLVHLGANYKVNKNVTLSANIYNLLDKDFNKFQKIGNTWYNDYYMGGRSVKGSAPEGRTLWLKANIEF